MKKSVGWGKENQRVCYEKICRLGKKNQRVCYENICRLGKRIKNVKDNKINI
jgi:hypothetical protein